MEIFNHCINSQGQGYLAETKACNIHLLTFDYQGKDG